MDLLIWCFHMSARSSPPSDDGRHRVANFILGFFAAQTKEPYQLFSLLVGNLLGSSELDREASKTCSNQETGGVSSSKVKA